MRSRSDAEVGPTPPALFFVHVMKTGGRSLYYALRQCYVVDERFPDRFSQTPVAEGAVAPLSPKNNLGLLLAQARLAPGSIRFFAPHLPAWVAEVAAPEAITVTALREPVARTVSHLRQISREPVYSDSVEEIWEDEGFRIRLTDYQTKVFGQDPGSLGEILHDSTETERWLTAQLEQPASSPTGDELDDFLKSLATSTYSLDPADTETLANAQRRLRRFDVVGTTDDLDAIVRRLCVDTGVPFPSPARLNTDPAPVNISEDLLDDIAAHTTLDRVLYETALELAA